MTGEFGGYGSYIRVKKDKLAYTFIAAVEGKPARTVKIIAYIPGCAITTLALSVSRESLSRTLTCKPLGFIPLHGQISPPAIVRRRPVAVKVIYYALWDHVFFGINDGSVTGIPIATVVPDDRGRFELQLPNFYVQNLGEGKFNFTLQEAKSGHLVALLQTSRKLDDLAVLPAYPPLVHFKAVKPQAIVPR